MKIQRRNKFGTCEKFSYYSFLWTDTLAPGVLFYMDGCVGQYVWFIVVTLAVYSLKSVAILPRQLELSQYWVSGNFPLWVCVEVPELGYSAVLGEGAGTGGKTN